MKENENKPEPKIDGSTDYSKINNTDPAGLILAGDRLVVAIAKNAAGEPAILRIWNDNSEIEQPPALQIEFSQPDRMLRFLAANMQTATAVLNHYYARRPPLIVPPGFLNPKRNGGI